MPHERLLVDAKLPAHVIKATQLIARHKHRAAIKVLQMHPQEFFSAWCDARGGSLTNRGAWDWGIIADLYFHWPHGYGFAKPHEWVDGGVKKSQHWQGWHWLRSNGYAREELEAGALSARQTFVLVSSSQLVGCGGNKEELEEAWDLAVDIMMLTGWHFLSIDATTEEIIKAAAQAGFKGALIVKDPA